jgi:puromycin-sensitive aminopeptidase
LVPVSVMGADGLEKASGLLDGRELKLAVAAVRESWIKLNPGQTGFYRTNYSPGLWQQLEAAVEEGKLGATDRLGLESDAFALSRAGYVSTTQALSLARAYRNEADYTVWADLSSNLHAYDLLLWDEPYFEVFRSYARDLYGPAYERLGWDARVNESHLTAMLRPMVIGILGGYGDAAVAAEACRRFDEASRQGTKLPPDLRSAVYGLVVENRGSEGHAAVLNIFRATDLNEEKTRCLRALGRSRDPDLLKQTLELSLSAEVRSQDTPLVIAGVAVNRCGRYLAWQFLQQRWDEFDRRYGRGGFLIARLIAATTENFSTLDKAREVEEFFESHPAPAAARTIRQSTERIRSNALWLERDREAIRAWLETYAKAR